MPFFSKTDISYLCQICRLVLFVFLFIEERKFAILIKQNFLQGLLHSFVGQLIPQANQLVGIFTVCPHKTKIGIWSAKAFMLWSSNNRLFSRQITFLTQILASLSTTVPRMFVPRLSGIAIFSRKKRDYPQKREINSKSLICL